MRNFRLLSKIVLSLFLGLFLALAWFQFDERFIALANSGMEKVFEKQLNCQFKGKVVRVNPFLLTIHFEDVQVEPFDMSNNWSWSVAQMTMKLSFLEYLYYGAFGLHVNLTTLHSFSGLKKNGVPMVSDHLLDLFAGANFSVPISFQTVAIVDGSLLVDDVDRKVSFICHWNSNAGKAGRDFKSKFYLSDTSLTLDNKKIFEQFSGQITFDALHGNAFIRMATDAMFMLPQLPEDQRDCYVLGSWDKNAGSFVVYNQDRTLSFVPIELVMGKKGLLVNAEGVILLEYLKRFFYPHISQTLKGMGYLKVSGDLNGSLQTKVRMQDVGYGSYLLDELYGDVMHVSSEWRGSIGATKNNAAVTGTWWWSDSVKQGVVQLVNRNTLPFLTSTYWQTLPGRTALQIVFKNDGNGKLEYVTQLAHKKTEHTVNSSGTVTHTNTTIKCSGSVGDNTYTATVNTKPMWLKSFIYANGAKKKLITLTTNKQNKFSLSFDYDAAQMFALDWLDLDLYGQGVFDVSGCMEFPKFVGTLSFKNGTIRPAGMYNFISDITARFIGDVNKKECSIKDTLITLHQGKIVSDKISCFFNDDGSVYGLHSPFRFESCFLNWSKYLYAICTGSFVLQVGSGVENALDGFLVFERSQFKENIFALQTQKSAINALPRQHALSSLSLNLGVSTQAPLLVSTPHLQTQAILDWFLTGKLGAPELQGSLQLKGGKLVFPGQTLAISQGKLTFAPTHSEDPLLDLTAQARIKKYLVTMNIGGTIKEPEVLLQATPGLSEEQIIMLLLTGSEQESFNIMVPSLVMRNLETILFGPSKALGHASNTLSSWLKPLEKVTFVPRFNDQTGTGGFKGVLEVEVSKRLRAVLEKDFSLAEDTAAEIEYLASDDVSFKVNRDERGDIGAEVEMRFKF